MLPKLDASFFVEEPPEIEYRHGLFHIIQTIGACRFERVMSPYVYMQTLRRAAETAREHKFGSAQIVELASRAEKEAAARH